MMEKHKTEFKQVIEPSESLMVSYRKLFNRNQSKWMRRSKLELSDLGKDFIWEDKTYTLEGAIDAMNMLVRETESHKYYRVHSDLVTAAFGLS
jgi:hypothetical protein